MLDEMILNSLLSGDIEEIENLLYENDSKELDSLQSEIPKFLEGEISRFKEVVPKLPASSLVTRFTSLESERQVYYILNPLEKEVDLKTINLELKPIYTVPRICKSLDLIYDRAESKFNLNPISDESQNFLLNLFSATEKNGNGIYWCGKRVLPMQLSQLESIEDKVKMLGDVIMNSPEKRQIGQAIGYLKNIKRMERGSSTLLVRNDSVDTPKFLEQIVLK